MPSIDLFLHFGPRQSDGTYTVVSHWEDLRDVQRSCFSTRGRALRNTVGSSRRGPSVMRKSKATSGVPIRPPEISRPTFVYGLRPTCDASREAEGNAHRRAGQLTRHEGR